MVLYGPKTPGCSQPLPRAWKNAGPQHSSHTLWELTTLIISTSHMTNCSRGYMDTDLWRHLWEQSWDDGKCGINKTFAKLQKKKKEKKNNHTSLYGHLVRAIFVWPWQGTRKQNGNNKRTEIERFDWFIERIQTRVACGWSANEEAVFWSFRLLAERRKSLYYGQFSLSLTPTFSLQKIQPA